MPDKWRFRVVSTGLSGLAPAFTVFCFRGTGGTGVELMSAKNGLVERSGFTAMGDEDSLGVLNLAELETLHAELHSIIPNSKDREVDTEALRSAIRAEVKGALSEFFGKMAK